MKNGIDIAMQATVVAVVAAVCASTANAGVIANWAFEANIPPTVTGPSVGPLVPDVGFGSLQGTHVLPFTMWDSLDTGGTGHAFGSKNWNFPSQDRYLMDVDTRGLSQIVISWLQSSAANGPTAFLDAYSTNSSTATTFISTYTATTVDTSFIADLRPITTVNNSKRLYFELVCTASASGRTQIDDLIVTGTLIDPHLIPLEQPCRWRLRHGLELVFWAGPRIGRSARVQGARDLHGLASSEHDQCRHRRLGRQCHAGPSGQNAHNRNQRQRKYRRCIGRCCVARN